jgi:hypothetical protein
MMQAIIALHPPGCIEEPERKEEEISNLCKRQPIPCRSRNLLIE